MPYPFKPFKIDSRFNQDVSYGKHEGLDLNGLSGGNTDCNTPLESISNGKCVHVSQATINYGNLAIIEVLWKGVIYWIRYCHLNVISVRPGDVVKIGTQIGTMGSTGNSTACHLHLDILKKKPSNWRFYSQSVTEWFVDPEWFILNYKEESMTEIIQVEKKDWDRARKSMDIVNDVHKKLNLSGDHIDIGSSPYMESISQRDLRVSTLEKQNSELQKKLNEKPITPIDEDVKYTINGKSVKSIDKNGVETVINYAVKPSK